MHPLYKVLRQTSQQVRWSKRIALTLLTLDALGFAWLMGAP